VVASNSLSSVAIYVADPIRQWDARPGYEMLRCYPVRNTGQYVDLLQILVAQPGTGFLVVGDGPGRVRVLNGSSELVITRRMFLGESYYMVRLDRGTLDPWKYLTNPNLVQMLGLGEFYSGKEWLEASAESQYPDAVVQCIQIFDSFRCGDIFVSLQPGWKCKASNYIATHGSMVHTDMSVPFVVSGPDIRRGAIPVARLTDIYPTALRLFGLSIPFGVLDGRPLDEILPQELCRETDPNDELRVGLLPAMRQLWGLETASAEQPLLPHQYRDALKKTPASLRIRIANMLRARRLRMARRLDDPEVRATGQAGGDAVESLLRTEEQELSRQIQWLDGGRTGDLSEHSADSISETQ
jgi:hypothetical protein